MKIQKAEHIVCYDVDGTLVSPDLFGTVCIENPSSGSQKKFSKHCSNIDLLKAHKGRGYFVKVWSAAGYRWAEAVVKALQLERYVDIVETKPTLLVDDLSIEKIFPAVIFLKD